MKKIFLAAACIALSFLAACGDNSQSGGETPTTTTLQAFIDDVKDCTPYLQNSFTAGGSDDLSVDSAWTPNYQGTILGKLFNPSNPAAGQDECFYNQIAILDDHIGLVNEFSQYWAEGGQHIISSVTATIDNTVKSVAVPYLNLYYPGLVNVAVDREITVVSGDLTVHMAFSISGSRQIIVDQYVSGGTLSGVYYTERNGNALKIWHASVRTRKVQFAWDGDMGDKTFRITECTDSGSSWDVTGNWEVMGGGSIASNTSQIALMARNNLNNDSNDEYYITRTYYNLLHWTTETPISAAVTPPDGSGGGVLAYIDEDMIQCIEFLQVAEYPNSVSDLAWTN